MSPAIERRLGRDPPDHSNAVSQKGVVADSSAAMPDATRCSAHASAPYEPANISAPANAAWPQCRSVARSPRTAAQTSISAPAAAHRTPIMNSGGMESTASLIAR